MKKLLSILIILLMTGFAYAKLSVTDLVVTSILKPYKSSAPAETDIRIDTASNTRIDTTGNTRIKR